MLPWTFLFFLPGLLGEVCHWSPLGGGGGSSLHADQWNAAEEDASRFRWLAFENCLPALGEGGQFPWKQGWHSNRQRFCMTQTEDRSSHRVSWRSTAWTWMQPLGRGSETPSKPHRTVKPLRQSYLLQQQMAITLTNTKS